MSTEEAAISRADQNAIDKELGQRIRDIRTAQKISQEALGKACGPDGVTFQQIQKYEKGTNRVSFSRLIQISRALNVDPIVFLEGFRPDDGAATLTATALLTENKLLKSRLSDIRKFATL